MTTKTKIVYSFNRLSPHKEYIGPVTLSEELGDLDTLESQIEGKDVWLIPGDCTLVQPGPEQTNKIQLFVAGNETTPDSWTYAVNYVGTDYWDTEGVKHTITEIGVDIPPGTSLTEPPPSLAKLKADRLAYLRNKATTFLLSGFKSNALGTEYSYGSDTLDQLNLTGNATSATAALIRNETSWTTKHLCGDADGVWEYREHTASQMIAVGDTFKSIMITILERNKNAENLLASLETDTAAKVAAVDYSTVI